MSSNSAIFLKQDRLQNDEKVSCAANPFTDNSLMVFLVLRPFTRCSRADIKQAGRPIIVVDKLAQHVQVVVVQKIVQA